jgi:hypothetical protein
MCSETETEAPGTRDRLVPFPDAARLFSRNPKTLDRWHEDGLMPAVNLPGGKAVFQSWLDAVFASPRPGRAATLAEITTCWWADHGITGYGTELRAVAS